MTTEQRRASRQPLIASAEVIELQTNTRLKARTLDMSLVGCYLDMTNPLPVGTEVKVEILHNDAAFTALGVIVNCAQQHGDGHSVHRRAVGPARDIGGMARDA